MSMVYNSFCNISLQPSSKAMDAAVTNNNEIRNHIFCIVCYCFNNGNPPKQYLHIVSHFLLGAYLCHLGEPFVCSFSYFIFNLSVSCLPVVEQIRGGLRLYYVDKGDACAK